MPVKLTDRGFPALLETVNVPARDPSAVGAKVALTVQVAPPASTVPQLLVCEKSPLVVMLEMFRGRLPAAINVIGCGVTVPPMNCLEKSMACGPVARPAPSAGLILPRKLRPGVVWIALARGTYPEPPIVCPAT